MGPHTVISGIPSLIADLRGSFKSRKTLPKAWREEQLRAVLKNVKECLLVDERVSDDPCRIRLIGYGRYSADHEEIDATCSESSQQAFEICHL